jgi:hypothetical protein
MSVKITVLKTMTGRATKHQFGNSYLFSGTPGYGHEASEDMLRAVVEMERLYYPNEVTFLRGRIQDINEYGEPIKYNYRSIPLNLVGAVVVPAGDQIAPPNIVAVIERQAVQGRNSPTFYRNAITTEEFNAYSETGAIPPRFARSIDDTDEEAVGAFQAFLGWVNAGELRPALPDGRGDIRVAMRQVRNVWFGGIRMNDDSRPRKSAEEAMREAVQMSINDLAKRARKEIPVGQTVIPASAAGARACLWAMATDELFRLDVRDRSLIKWPKDGIFGTGPATGATYLGYKAACLLVPSVT